MSSKRVLRSQAERELTRSGERLCRWGTGVLLGLLAVDVPAIEEMPRLRNVAVMKAAEIGETLAVRALQSEMKDEYTDEEFAGMIRILNRAYARAILDEGIKLLTTGRN